MSAVEVAHTRSVGTGMRQWFTSIPMTLILLITLLATVGESLHTRVLEVGGALWPDYTQLRIIDQISAPKCQITADPEAAIEAEYQRRLAAAADDPFADVIGATADRAAIRTAFETHDQVCQHQWQVFERVQAAHNGWVQAYATAELALSKLVTGVTVNRRVLLGLMILFCMGAATIKREHIGLRQVETWRDDFVSTLFQLVSNAILALSAFSFRQQEYAAAADGMQLNFLLLQDFFVVGFSALTLVTLYQLFHLRPGSGQGSWGRAFLAVPLYCYMCLNAIVHFAGYGFYHGIHVYMNVLLENAALFLNIGLYVWVGVLLIRTQLPSLVFDFIRVWRLPPKWLGVIMLLLTAPPTAYTGASAVLILAAGPALYQELRRAGQNEQLALATTALAGSMGTMLRPCLLVVIVAAVNNMVTTDELYSAGARVLFVSLAMYAFYVFLLGGESKQKMAPLNESVPAAVQAFKPLIPYIVLFAGVVIAWRFIMNQPLDEFTAPAMLPIIMLLWVAYERLGARGKLAAVESVPRSMSEATTETMAATLSESTPALTTEPTPTIRAAIARASDQAAPLIGALVILISLSMSTGGMIERTQFIEIFPEVFPATWMALAALAAMLVFVGMVMDPFGAVILVNATLAPIAQMNGVHPIHFWVITLLAFEMGYLTPPVALNHLITRQVVGPPQEWESLHGTFWQRNFRYIFPILVMFSALLIVTFLPLWIPHLFF